MKTVEEIIALLKLDGMELNWRVLIKQKGGVGVVAIAYEDTPEKTLLTAWKNYEDNRRNNSVA